MKNTLVVPYLARAGMACLLALPLALGLSGCGSNPDRDRPENPFKKAPAPGDAKAPLSDAELHVEADKLYRQAHESVESADWSQAKTRLDKLIARYPFSDYATQAEMEIIYVGYKGGKPDEALSDADRFLRAHPRSTQAEYVQYLKGLISFTRDEGFLDTLGINNSPRKDVSNARRSYDDFALLLQRYPTSKYVGDARRRMIYLRNRIADHDLTVAQYYLRRGAFIAAARRAQSVISEYPGAPATEQALAILEKSYRQAGLAEQADDAAHIIATNADNKPFKQPARPIGSQAYISPTPAAYRAADSVSAAPPPPPAAAPAAATTAIEADTKPTLIERFTHLFDIFDTSKPEHQYTVTLPALHGDDAGSSVPSAPAAASSNTSTNSTGAAASTGTTTTAPTPAAAPAAATPKPHTLEMSVGAPDTDSSNAAKSDATTAPPPNKP